MGQRGRSPALDGDLPFRTVRIQSVWASCKKQRVALIDWLTDANQAVAGLRVTPTLLATQASS